MSNSQIQENVVRPLPIPHGLKAVLPLPPQSPSPSTHPTPQSPRTPISIHTPDRPCPPPQDIATVYQIFPDEVLGSGQFGVVYGGKHASESPRAGPQGFLSS